MSENEADDLFPKRRKKDHESPETSSILAKRPCLYGKNCYRRNPQHFAEFSHPDTEDLPRKAARSNLPESSQSMPLLPSQRIESTTNVTAKKSCSSPSGSPARRSPSQSPRGVYKRLPVFTVRSPSTKKPQTNTDEKLEEIDFNTQCAGPSSSNEGMSKLRPIGDNTELNPTFESKFMQELTGRVENVSSTKTANNAKERFKNTNFRKDFTGPSSSVNHINCGKEKVTETSEPSSNSQPLQGFAAMLEAASPYNYFLTKVKASKATHCDPRSIVFHDLLDRGLGKLHSSLQINFMVDGDWLIGSYEFKGLQELPLTIWYDCLTEDQYTWPDNVAAAKVVVPSAFGHHHTKMSLLYYEDKSLRIAVSTANLIESDWANRTQGVWVSPACPKLQGGHSVVKGESRSGFKEALLQYFKGYNSFNICDFDLWFDRVLETDFSAINVCLVTSIPKTHDGRVQVVQHGHRRMRDLLAKHATVPQPTWPVIAQTSSIGTLGVDYSSWLGSQLVGSLSQTKSGSLLQPAPFRFIYPSFKNVEESYDGLAGGTCLPYRTKTHDKQTWLKSYMYHWKSNSCHRSRALPHIKTYARVSPDGKKAAWFLLTSANLSKAAWGTMNKAGTGLYLMSYEAGVLFIPELVLANGATEFNLYGEHALTLPYDLPLTSYSSHDTPWFSDLLNYL